MSETMNKGARPNAQYRLARRKLNNVVRNMGHVLQQTFRTPQPQLSRVRRELKPHEVPYNWPRDMDEMTGGNPNWSDSQKDPFSRKVENVYNRYFPSTVPMKKEVAELAKTGGTIALLTKIIMEQQRRQREQQQQQQQRGLGKSMNKRGNERLSIKQKIGNRRMDLYRQISENQQLGKPMENPVLATLYAVSNQLRYNPKDLARRTGRTVAERAARAVGRGAANVDFAIARGRRAINQKEYDVRTQMMENALQGTPLRNPNIATALNLIDQVQGATRGASRSVNNALTRIRNRSKSMNKRGTIQKDNRVKRWIKGTELTADQIAKMPPKQRREILAGIQARQAAYEARQAAPNLGGGAEAVFAPNANEYGMTKPGYRSSVARTKLEGRSRRKGNIAGLKLFDIFRGTRNPLRERFNRAQMFGGQVTPPRQQRAPKPASIAPEPTPSSYDPDAAYRRFKRNLGLGIGAGALATGAAAYLMNKRMSKRMSVSAKSVRTSSPKRTIARSNKYM